MARVFGREVGKETLRGSVGDMSQICGIQSFAFDDGPGRGVRGLEFRTGGGLRFVVLPDRAMDLYCAEYRGVPLNWMSGTGPVSPGLYSSRGWEWLRSFFGGLRGSAPSRAGSASGKGETFVFWLRRRRPPSGWRSESLALRRRSTGLRKNMGSICSDSS